MHALDVLKYGNLTVLKTIQKLPPDDWNTAGVCGWWSVREIVAHLASFEYILIEVLNVAGGMRPSHFLIDMLHNGQAFNDTQVAARSEMSPAETLAEYEDTHRRTMRIAHELPAARFTVTGLLPDYGEEYDLQDYIAYAFYGHKREHSAQIAVFRDGIKR